MVLDAIRGEKTKLKSFFMEFQTKQKTTWSGLLCIIKPVKKNSTFIYIPRKRHLRAAKVKHCPNCQSGTPKILINIVPVHL